MSRYYRGLIQGGAPPVLSLVAVGHLLSSTIDLRTFNPDLTQINTGLANSTPNIVSARAIHIDEGNGDIYYGAGEFVERFDKDLNFIWSFNCDGIVKAIHRIGAGDIVVGHVTSSSVNLRRIAIGGSQVWGVDTQGDVEALDVDTNGDIIIGTSSSTNNRRLQKINPSTGASIWNVSPFSVCRSLKVRPSDNGIYLQSSSASLALRLFNTSGASVSGIQLSNGGTPRSIDIDSNEDVFVIGSTGADQIYKFSKDLSTEITVTGGSVQRNQIAVGPDDTIYVIGQVSSGDYLFRYSNNLATILNSFNTGANGQSVGVI